MQTTHKLIPREWGEHLALDFTYFENDCAVAFMDPPDNIGLKYSENRDKRPDDEYGMALEDWMREAWMAVDRDLWVSFNAMHTRLVSRIVDRMCTTWPGLECREMVQVFTFGQHNKHDFGRNYRPLWRLRRGSSTFVDQIRVPSQRQLTGDKRANPDGRVPGDVWDFPRVTGNSSQRRKWHPTQLHGGLLERFVLASTEKGDTVLDLFSGTGSLIRVCKRLGRNTVSVESSPYYCEMIAKEHPDVELVMEVGP